MGASYEEVVALQKKRAREKAAKAKASPGLVGAFVRGVQTSPAFANTEGAPTEDVRVQGEVSQPRDTADELVMRSGAGPMSPPDWNPSQLSDADIARLRAAHGHRSSVVTNINPPQTTGEEIAQSVGQDSPFIAAGALLGLPATAAMGVGVPAAMGGELLLGGVGSAAGHTIEQQGGNVPTQMLGEALATAATPIAIPAKIGKRLGIRAASHGISEAAALASAEAAARHGVDPNVWMRAAAELKRKFARGTKDPEKYIRGASANLERDINAFGDTTPTLAQSAGEYGGTNIASMELQLAKHDQEYAADSLGRRLDVQENLLDDFEKNRPGGSLGEAQKGLADARRAAVMEERVLWDRLPEMHSPLLPTNGIKQAINRLRKGPKASRKYIPDEADVIDSFGMQEPIQEIQALRSELLDTLREAQAYGASPELRRKARRIMPVLEEIQKVLDDIPNMPNPSGGDNAAFAAAYEAARNATKRNAQLFSPEREALDALTNLTEAQRVVAKLKNAADPVDEVNNLRQIYQGNPDAETSLRQMVWDDLFGETLGDRSARTMENNLSRKREFYRAVFGDDGLQVVEEIIRRQRVAATGKAGTAAQAASTGTGQSMIEQLVQHASHSKGPIWSAMSYTGRYLKDKALSTEEVNALLVKATQDIRLAKALLDDPTPAARTAWRIAMDQGIAQVRQEAKRQTARGASRRVFSGKATKEKKR